jgi:hypothetical protein
MKYTNSITKKQICGWASSQASAIIGSSIPPQEGK